MYHTGKNLKEDARARTASAIGPHGESQAMAKPKMFALLKETFNDWLDDNAPKMAAALSYYTLFSIAPLLVIAIAISAWVLGQQGAANRISYEIQGLVGPTGAIAIQTLVESANRPRAGLIATIVGVATLLFGASGVFGELQDSLNTIWDVKPRPGAGFLDLIKNRFLSFAMVLCTGFLLLVSLALSAWLAAFGELIEKAMPGSQITAHVINFVVSLIVFTLLFAMLYKVLPDAKIEWKHVWLGAAVTAGLFTVGKTLIGFYLGRSAVASSYGAAGSVIVVLLWVNYSSLIVLFGAEFTHVYARSRQALPEPEDHAVKVGNKSWGNPRSYDSQHLKSARPPVIVRVMASTPSTMMALGTRAPDFTLPDVVTGKTVALPQFTGKKALLAAFICRHCPYVVHLREALAQLGRDYEGTGLAIVAISSNDAKAYPDDAPARLKAMAEELGFPFPLCYDETQATAKAYTAACTPDFFLFDQDRRLVYRGRFDETRPGTGTPTGADLRAAVDAALAGKPVDPDQKPSIGCSIKWKPGNQPNYRLG